MKFLAVLGAVALMGASPQARAQLWTNVYNSADDGLRGTSGDMGADAGGNVFAAGRYYSPTDGSSVAIVQGASGNPGSTWELLDAYSEPGRSYSYHRAGAANPNVPGHFFAGGNLNNVLSYDAEGNPIYEFDGLWIIRERDPVTGLWHNADDYTRLAVDLGNKPLEDRSGQASVSELRVANDGAVYAAGGGAYSGWIVRKRSATGLSFVNVDVVAPSSAAWGMTVDGVYGVIVTGQVGGYWTVRQSATGDANTWTQLERVVQVRRGEWGSGLAKGAVVSSSGTIYVAGTLYNNTTGKNHWVVRSKAVGGTTWTVSDNVIPPGVDAEATGIVADAYDNVYACGRVQEADGYHWIVRKGTLTTKLVKGKTVTTVSWSTVDRLQGIKSRANAITIDAFGNVFAGGSETDQAGVLRLIVRKLPAQ